MDFTDSELDNVLNIFQQESTEIIQSINECIETLFEDKTNLETHLQLFRLAHSLKGSARMMGFNNIQALAHKMEDVIGLLKENKTDVTDETLNLLSQTVEYISFLINKTVENKEEYVTDELNNYIEKLQNVPVKEIQVKKEDDKEEEENEKKPFVQIKALVAELALLYLKYRNDGDQNYIHEFRIKLVELKNSFRINNFEDEITALNNTLGEICKSSPDTQNQNESDEKLLEFLKVFDSFCLKNNIQTENYLEIAKKQFEEINNISNHDTQNQTVDIKKIRDDVNQEVLSLIKEINNDIDEVKSNPNFLDKFKEKIDKITSQTKYFEIKKLFETVKKVIIACVSKNFFPANNLNLLKQLISDSIDTIEDASSSNVDFKIIEDRTYLIEKTFEDELNAQPIKTEIKETREEKRTQQFNSKDWLNNVDNSEIKTLRVDSSKLDKLASQVSELIMYRIKNTEHIALFKQFQYDFEEWIKSWHKVGYYLKYYEKRYLSGADKNLDVQSVIMHNRQLISFYEIHSTYCSKMLDFVNLISKQLQEEDLKLVSLSNEFEAMSKTLRILPLATIFHLFPRMIHNISTEKGKQIDFVIEGSDVSADKKIIEEIKIPLIHMLRNSIDHGVETPEERIEQGKPPVGKIGIKAWVEGNKICIDVKDDGRGLDVKKIRSIALQKGFIKDEDKNYTNEDIIDFIFYPGFSTEEKVTEISGRGLGLNIVKEKISQLDGKIDIYSKLNEGTCFRIELPIAMSTINVFIVKEHGEYYAIDTSCISIVTKISTDDITVQDGKSCFIYNKKVIPIFSLSQILGLEDKKTETDKNTVMILEYEGNNLGIVVDKLVGDQEIIQKKLSPPLLNVKSVSGVATLANGETCLILSIKDVFSFLSKNLLLNITHSNKLLLEEKKSQHNILVVDDSLTIRTLQQNILKNHGYNVETAYDGVDALEKIKDKKYDLLIIDCDMPRMTGVELTKTVREDLKSDVPVIILTSYERGLLEEQFKPYNILAYLQKNNFEQNSFTDLIDKILLNDEQTS